MAENTKLKKRGRGRPRTKGNTRALSFAVNLHVYEYLTYLSRHSMLGSSENAVALRLLTDRVEEMRESGYQMREIPWPHDGDS